MKNWMKKHKGLVITVVVVVIVAVAAVFVSPRLGGRCGGTAAGDQTEYCGADENGSDSLNQRNRYA